MRESSTYQAILEEGAITALHNVIPDQGHVRFGKAEESTKHRVESISDVSRLKRLAKGLLNASSWEELLAID